MDKTKRILRDDYEEMNRLLWVLVTEDTAVRRVRRANGDRILRPGGRRSGASRRCRIVGRIGAGLTKVSKALALVRQVVKAVANIPSFEEVEPINLVVDLEYQAAMREDPPDAGSVLCHWKPSR